MMFLFCIIYIQSKDDIKMWVHTCQWMLQYRIFQAGKMLWTLLSKASTMIFCCIMSKARLTETKWAGGHISVGPKTKKKQNIFNLGIVDPVLLAVFEFWFHKQKNSWNCTLLGISKLFQRAASIFRANY